MVDNLVEIVQEIHKLRDDMRSDVKELHDKIERFHDKTDRKIEDQRSCIVEKIDKQREERNTCYENCSQSLTTKVSSTWFRWIVGFIVVGVFAIGGYSAANRAELKELNTSVQQHMENSNRQIDEIKKVIEKHTKEHRNANTKIGGK